MKHVFLAALVTAGLLAGAGIAAAQDGSAGMDELDASIDDADGEGLAARDEEYNYEQRIRENSQRLDDHEARLRALEERFEQQQQQRN